MVPMNHVGPTCGRDEWADWYGQMAVAPRVAPTHGTTRVHTHPIGATDHASGDNRHPDHAVMTGIAHRRVGRIRGHSTLARRQRTTSAKSVRSLPSDCRPVCHWLRGPTVPVLRSEQLGKQTNPRQHSPDLSVAAVQLRLAPSKIASGRREATLSVVL